MKVAYETPFGQFYLGDSSEISSTPLHDELEGAVSLIFTSPPFPLKRKKKYGNKNGEEYIQWLVDLIKGLLPYLKKDGSLVIEVGNAWEAGTPEMSTLPLEALLEIKKQCNLHLCQTFVWHNTAKLPGPAEWVNVKRIRVKDNFTHIWWLSKTPLPKADNRKVLQEYSASMKKLLKSQKYNAGVRPSEHYIGDKSFLKKNKGAIPGSVIASSNTSSNSAYQRYCKENNILMHPARMPNTIPEFFIKFLTKEKDLILDPFGGSNTTGSVAENLKRRWIAFEVNETYVNGSKGHFINGTITCHI